jgi:hypothetical protein
LLASLCPLYRLGIEGFGEGCLSRRRESFSLGFLLGGILFIEMPRGLGVESKLIEALSQITKDKVMPERTIGRVLSYLKQRDVIKEPFVKKKRCARGKDHSQRDFKVRYLQMSQGM